MARPAPPSEDSRSPRRAGVSALALTSLIIVLAIGFGVIYLAVTYHAEPALKPATVVALPPPAVTAPADPPPSASEPAPPQTAAVPTLTPQPAPAIAPTPLAPAPDPALVVNAPLGPLPVIAPDGRQAWKVYARPLAEGPRRPRVAILLTGLGLSDPQTQAAVQLPGEVTLGFLPHAHGLMGKIADARAAGHEILLQVPMEPRNYPNDDPGPHALLTSVTPAANLERLEWSLSRGVGYVGVINRRGAKLAESAGDMRPVLQALRDRGLLYLDASGAQTPVALQLADELRLPRVTVDRRIDQEASRGAIDQQLAELETMARRGGQAVGIGEPFPVTIERLAAWSVLLSAKGIELAPISAMPVVPEKP